MQHARARRRVGWLTGSFAWVGALLVALLALGGAGCRRTRTAPTGAPVTALGADYGALRADFTRDFGHPRILIVVSPT